MEKKTFSGAEDIIVLHGDDQLAINEDLSRIKDDTDGFADLNTTSLDGAVASHSDISMHLNMLPMGTGKRKVILDQAQDALKKKEDRAWLETILEKFPPTTQLVLILKDEKKYQHGTMDWGTFNLSHWLRKVLGSFSGATFWQERSLPDARNMPRWIADKAIAFGGDFHPSAAHALVTLVGNDLFQAQQEIQKAIAYAGVGNQVTAADVRLLCAASKEENIFSLVDAVGQRDGKTATRLYQELSVDMAPQYIFSMLVRQIRLILQASIVLDRRGTAKDVVEACEIKSEWQANKLINQARHFKTRELENIYQQLDRIDEESKIGHISLEAAIESLLVSVTTK